MRPLGQDLRDLLGCLHKHHVRYLVVGGFAVAVHGVPRYTKDLDVPDNAAKVVAAIDDFGFASLGLTADDFLQSDMVVQLGYEPNRVDLLTGLSGVQFDDVYPKRITATIDGIEVPIIDRASLITNKRALGRAQDLADAEELDR